MSSANVDLVRAIYAVWERGDYRSTEWADPEIEFAMVGGPEPAAATGVTGMAQAWRKWLGAWDEFGAERRSTVRSTTSASL
jgi:ketosteroid isomerase-like protein